MMEMMKNELTFPGKKHPYEKLCCNESYKHPAKADYWMMEWIIKNMTAEGDVILDPMAGVGRTGVSAILNHRKCIMIEIEEKFIEWAKMSMEGISCLVQPDMYKIIHGDSRNISGLLSQEDIGTIVTSPPYPSKEAFRDPEFTLKSTKTNPSPRPLKDRNYAAGTELSSKDGHNIGNLPVGNVDVVVTSPPYGNSIRSKKNTGRLGREERLRQAGYDPKDYMGGDATACNMEWVYSHNGDNIGNLPDRPIDAIITSPPYEKAQKGGGMAIKGHHDDPKLAQRCYSQNVLKMTQGDGNIQGLGKETYYNAMMTVYSQCYDVLKPGGIIVIIVKDYIRNFKRVPLARNTITMLETVGFEYQESYFRKLNNFSFWVWNYRKKYPDADKVNHEEIIIAVKPVYGEKFNELKKKADRLLEENENLFSTIRQNIDELKSRCKEV